MKTFSEFVSELDPTFFEGEDKKDKCDDKAKDKDGGKKKFSFFNKKGKDDAKDDGDDEGKDEKPFPAKKNPFLKGKKDKKED